MSRFSTTFLSKKGILSPVISTVSVQRKVGQDSIYNVYPGNGRISYIKRELNQKECFVGSAQR
jgi:hypothetical protein